MAATGARAGWAARRDRSTLLPPMLQPPLMRYALDAPGTFFAEAIGFGIERVEVGWLGHHVVPHRFVASINWRMSLRSDRG